MAQITKTIVFPVPTEYYGDTQDTNRSGICTYTGPDRITFWYTNVGTEESPDWVQEHCFPTDTPEDRDPPADSRVVELNADTHPLNAVALWGGIAGPDLIETPAGPVSEPNPILPDYLHFHEVYDMESLTMTLQLVSGKLVDSLVSTPRLLLLTEMVFKELTVGTG